MGVVYLVRHGQASFGKADYDQLSETGIEQSRVLGASLRARVSVLDIAYVGAMRRHRETAEHCLAAYGSVLRPRLDEGFNEFDHDEVVVRYKPLYANRLLLMADMARTLAPRRAFQAMFEEAVARWVSGRHDDEYRESWPAFRARCVQAIERLVRELGPSKTAIVFTSGGPVTAICQSLLRIPDEHAFAFNRTLVNGGITKLVYGDRGLHLSTANEHGHYEGAARRLITYR